MTRRGFTLVELLVALVMLGIVSASVYQMLVSNQRVYRQQTQRIELNDNLRSAIAMVPGELRELSANDPTGGDIVAMEESTITYKALRNLYSACSAAVVVPFQGGERLEGGVLYLDPEVIGLRPLDPDRDSLLVLAERRTDTLNDDVWVRLNLVSVTTGNNCPGVRPSINVTVSPALLTSDTILRWAPVRGFEHQEIRKYPDAGGNVWIGSRRYHKVSGWSGLQPLVGPLAGRGLVLEYFDSTGTTTTDVTRVARISVTIIGRTSQQVETSAGTIDYLLDTLVTNVALRNNR